MKNEINKLFELLTLVYRLMNDPQGGETALKDYLRLIAEMVQGLEENIDQLYDDLFIETCDSWVIPYIRDLIRSEALDAKVPVAERARAVTEFFRHLEAGGYSLGGEEHDREQVNSSEASHKKKGKTMAKRRRNE